MPKISVIVPNYNHVDYLRQRIDSILNQTFQDFEVILLDDRSGDSSKEVLESYRRHPKVSQIVLNTANSGSTFKQWRKGVDLAQGEYIWIAESDDYAEPDFIETLFKKIQDDPSVGLVYCQSWLVDSEGTKIKFASDFEGTRWDHDYKNNGVDECAQHLITQNTIVNASSVIFKKSIFNEVFEQNSLRLTGDWLLWFDLVLKCNIAYVARPLNYFRKHAKNVRNNPDVQVLELKECVFVIENIRKKVKANPARISLAYRLIVNRMFVRFINFLSMSKSEIDELIAREFPGDALPNELRVEVEGFYQRNYLTVNYKNFLSVLVRRVINKIERFTGRPLLKR